MQLKQKNGILIPCGQQVQVTLIAARINKKHGWGMDKLGILQLSVLGAGKNRSYLLHKTYAH